MDRGEVLNSTKKAGENVMIMALNLEKSLSFLLKPEDVDADVARVTMVDLACLLKAVGRLSEVVEQVSSTASEFDVNVAENRD